MALEQDPRREGGTPDATEETWSPLAGALARVLVAGRWLIVVAWLAAAGFAWLSWPPFGVGGDGLSDITSADNPALVAERQAAEDFGFPALSRTMLVQHDPAGLPEEAVTRAVERAREVTEAGDAAGIAAALPIPADDRLPGVRAAGTTVVTFLYPGPEQNLAEATASARAYADGFDREADRVVGVTGTLPARAEQMTIVNDSLRLVEVVSVAAVLAIVALAFRSLVAPLLALGVAGLAFVLVTRTSAFVSQRWDVPIPQDLEPLMVALMLGVATDYVVYFLSGLRAELAAGHGRVDAARRATATFAPIVLVAGLTISAGVATLMLSGSPAVRVFGPAMALTVLITVAVSVTVLPALLAILGKAAFWPGSVTRKALRGGLFRRATVRVLRVRVGALVVAVLVAGGLLLAAAPIVLLRGGLPFVSALPPTNEVARAATAAGTGFAPGVVSPTLVGVRVPEGAPQGAYEKLEQLLVGQPHVEAVIGPAEDAVVSGLAQRDAQVFVRADRRAAQYLLVLDADPLDAVAVGAVQDLRRAMPDLVRQAGLPEQAQVAIGGDTAAVAAVIEQSDRDLGRILLAAMLVNLVLLMVFLRALIAPLFLLACTVLSASATIGLTVLLFQEQFGHPGITFFVPLAAGVLLVALGSDYNLFAIGHVFQEARRLPLRDAMLVALPRSSGAITTAGIALAASLGALALIPLRQFQELAFALVVGILIDALLVRTLLAPALLSLFGRFSGWPGRRLHGPVESRDG